MALIKCPECGKEVSKSAKQCPNCGKVLRATGCNGCILNLLKLFGVFVVLGIIGGIYSDFMNEEKKAPIKQFQSEKYGEEWPFTANSLEIACRGTNREVSIIAIVNGKTYSLNQAAKEEFQYPYPEEIMKEDVAFNLKADFPAAKQSGLGKFAMGRFSETLEIGRDIDKYCGIKQ